MDETEHHADADINQSLKYIQFFKKQNLSEGIKLKNKKRCISYVVNKHYNLLAFRLTLKSLEFS